MEIQLPDAVATRIKKFIEANPGETPLDVVQKALDRLEEDRFDRFAGYRGMAAGWSLEQMLADRREGLR